MVTSGGPSSTKPSGSSVGGKKPQQQGGGSANASSSSAKVYVDAVSRAFKGGWIRRSALRVIRYAMRGSPPRLCPEVEQLVHELRVMPKHINRIYGVFCDLRDRSKDLGVRAGAGALATDEAAIWSLPSLVQYRRKWVTEKCLMRLLEFAGCYQRISWSQFLYLFLRFNTLSKVELAQVLYFLIIRDVKAWTIHYLTCTQLYEYFSFFEDCPVDSFRTSSVNFATLPLRRYTIADFVGLCIQHPILLGPILYLQREMQKALPSTQFWDDSDRFIVPDPRSEAGNENQPENANAGSSTSAPASASTKHGTRKIDLQFFRVRQMNLLLRVDMLKDKLEEIGNVGEKSMITITNNYNGEITTTNSNAQLGHLDSSGTTSSTSGPLQRKIPASDPVIDGTWPDFTLDAIQRSAKQRRIRLAHLYRKHAHEFATLSAEDLQLLEPTTNTTSLIEQEDAGGASFGGKKSLEEVDEVLKKQWLPGAVGHPSVMNPRASTIAKIMAGGTTTMMRDPDGNPVGALPTLLTTKSTTTSDDHTCSSLSKAGNASGFTGPSSLWGNKKQARNANGGGKASSSSTRDTSRTGLIPTGQPLAKMQNRQNSGRTAPSLNSSSRSNYMSQRYDRVKRDVDNIDEVPEWMFPFLVTNIALRQEYGELSRRFCDAFREHRKQRRFQRFAEIDFIRSIRKSSDTADGAAKVGGQGQTGGGDGADDYGLEICSAPFLAQEIFHCCLPGNRERSAARASWSLPRFQVESKVSSRRGSRSFANAYHRVGGSLMNGNQSLKNDVSRSCVCILKDEVHTHDFKIFSFFQQ
ncbi:unnamed protein product [Amoebophrya sp. A25]|nr:unnamed protein product [Amoebophrya sp. A25]|eukprot:GSA25T00018304001.1